MSKFSIRGNVGDLTSVDGDGNSIVSESDSSSVKWLIVGVVAAVLIVGLAWGVNRFVFTGLGVSGGSESEVRE